MRIKLRFCEAVMDAVRSDPLDGRVLDRQCAQSGQTIFQPLRYRKASVGKQSVPAETHPEPADDPIEDQQSREICPSERKEQRNCSEMKDRNYSEVLIVDPAWSIRGERGFIFHLK
jgi:hypothetical protein